MLLGGWFLCCSSPLAGTRKWICRRKTELTVLVRRSKSTCIASSLRQGLCSLRAGRGDLADLHTVTQGTCEEKIVQRATEKLFLDALVIQQGRLKEKVLRQVVGESANKTDTCLFRTRDCLRQMCSQWSALGPSRSSKPSRRQSPTKIL